jgi:hypothetical protein
MSRLSSELMGQGDRPPQPTRPATIEFASSGLLLTGLAVVAVGALAWYYFGPDLVRYMKIRDM